MKTEFIRVGRYFDIKKFEGSHEERSSRLYRCAAPVCTSDARGTMKRGSAASGSSTGTD